MYNYKNKSDNIKLLNKYMLSRTLSMFNYQDLPYTLPDVEIEKQLQKNGFTFITKVKDELYAFHGGFGGEMNAYGEPTTININNPYLNFNESLNIEKDGVLIKNDDMQLGLMLLYEKYNSLLIENEVTMFLQSYNTRIQQLISAGDDSTKESAELYIKKIIEGELGIIAENRLFEGINVQNATTSNVSGTTQLIEFNQYLKATLYNEVGLNANFNMKRERLNSSEVDMNSDNLHPLVDNMLMNRQKGIHKLNEMYGLDASVEFGSIWKVRNENILDESDTVQDETSEPATETELDEAYEINEIVDDVITDREEPILEDEEPIEEQEEPLLENEEPTLEDDEPATEQEEPILDDEESIAEDENKEVS